MANPPTREEALELLHTRTKTDGLRRHALSVEAVTRYMAQKRGHDVEKWGVIGLIHDLAYEQYPERHCDMTRQILEQHDWPEEYIRAAVSHGSDITHRSRTRP